MLAPIDQIERGQSSLGKLLTLLKPAPVEGTIFPTSINPAENIDETDDWDASWSRGRWPAFGSKSDIFLTIDFDFL